MSSDKMADVAVMVTYQTRYANYDSKVCLVNGAELLIDLELKAREVLYTQHNIENVAIVRISVILGG